MILFNEKLAIFFKKILSVIINFLNYILSFCVIIFSPKYLFSKQIIILNNSKIIERRFRHNNIISHAYISFKTSYASCLSYCNNLKYVYIINSKEIMFKTFINCTNLKFVFIRNSTEKIHNYAFCNCTNLKIIFIPKTIKIIKSNAFYNCNNLTKIYFY